MGRYRRSSRGIRCGCCAEYQKAIQLEDVLKALKQPESEQYVEISPDIAARARRSLDRMFELEKKGKALLEKQGRSILPWPA